MRLTCAIGGALLLMCAVPTGQAAEATTPRPMAPACDAPVANPGAVKHVVHHYRRVYRRAPVRLVEPDAAAPTAAQLQYLAAGPL